MAAARAKTRALALMARARSTLAARMAVIVTAAMAVLMVGCTLHYSYRDGGLLVWLTG